MQNKENYNLGGSHKAAFQYAIDNKFDYLIVIHGDNQGDINDIKDILRNKTYKNYDCCLGARFMKGSKLINYSKFRIFGNICFNLLFSVCLFKKLYDLGGGHSFFYGDITKYDASQCRHPLLLLSFLAIINNSAVYKKFNKFSKICYVCNIKIGE